jgi:hypothetical protein
MTGLQRPRELEGRPKLQKLPTHSAVAASLKSRPRFCNSIVYRIIRVSSSGQDVNSRVKTDPNKELTGSLQAHFWIGATKKDLRHRDNG